MHEHELPAPSPPGVGVGPDTVIIDSNVKKSIDAMNARSRLPPSTVARINAVAAKFRKLVHSWKISERHLRKLQERFSALQAEKIPTGMPPHKLSFTAKDWLESPPPEFFSVFADGKLQACKSYEEVRSKMRLMSLFYTTTLDLAVQQLRVEKLRKQCPLEVLVASCLAEVEHELQVLQRHTQGIGIPPGLLGVHEEPARNFATKRYRSILTAEAFALEKEAKAAEKATKDKAHILEGASKLDSKEVLEACFDDFLKRRSRGNGKSSGKPFVDFASMLKLEVSTPMFHDSSSPNSKSPSTNGVSPAPSRGTINNKKIDGKGKGNTRPKTSQEGRGSKHGNSSGPGKGKGKQNRTTVAWWDPKAAGSKDGSTNSKS